VLRHIDRQKYQMDFLVHTTDPGAYDEEVKPLGAKIIPCLQPSNPALYAKNFFSILRECGPYDVVHSHVHHYSGYVLMLAAMAGVKARIAHSHNDTRSVESKKLRRRAYLVTMRTLIRLFATKGLAVSSEAGSDLFESQWRQYSDKWRLQHLGIDLSRFEIEVNREKLRHALGIPLNAVVIGHVGRFSEQKNHAFFVEVAREVVRLESRSRFLFVGDGPLRTAIEKKVGNYDLAKHFVFAGLRSDVPALMKGAMDILLFPSSYEGLPIALLEAQAAGLTCLVADGISPEVEVVPGLIRRQSLEQTPTQWASQLLQLLSTPPVPADKLRSAMASRSILTSKDKLSAFYAESVTV
jgi:glycosyltransferase involved in cell wall biosynthesis